MTHPALAHLSLWLEYKPQIALARLAILWIRLWTFLQVTYYSGIVVAMNFVIWSHTFPPTKNAIFAFDTARFMVAGVAEWTLEQYRWAWRTIRNS